ncbi:transcriptional regulator [Virgibacillus pantothenticus]|uniref:Transcriptional regulator n=1 Tax=Virgibacillus pantothenticus TaxID=1473 RepID=A0A0L0QR89_VIRPA|nr:MULTISPECIES: helix-turn-helix transcriptional regulator [Virgibacillus]API92342.1 transcriptional regulator [Virgibacillus sp. 6R]KNE21051.1 transcriptional regulator [Virgibacillus pantothenticus]MBS7427059.1 helix-turn-helix transcriptional regulator [Virgibacillus sp. 19R1-5]MBU8568120.1 helix-turn-helix domain-containing protein [Virgibacillus pantothenticus]MBU8602132.1 helix-turn-helix domain-containing protein [Virgibacillus pantothenticus]
MDQKRIGRRLKAFRKLKGYTQAEFAKELDIPLSVIGGIERGVKPISDELIDIVVHTLNISKDELMLHYEDNQDR